MHLVFIIGFIALMKFTAFMVFKIGLLFCLAWQAPKFQFPPSAERAFEPRKAAERSLLEPVGPHRSIQMYRCM